MKILLGIGAEETPVVTHDSPIYANIVQPIFKEHCVRCHNPDKLKGGFRLDTREGLLQGGKSGKPAIVLGAVADSELLRRVKLPRRHRKAMPPKEQDGLRVITRNRRTALDATAAKALLPLAPYVVAIDLSGTRVDGEALASFSEFAALEKLKLYRARIGDADLKPLAKLAKLQRLNLLGTAVTDAAVEILAGFPALHYVNLYATAVSDDAAAELQQRLPVCTVVSVGPANPAMVDTQGLTDSR